MSALRIHVVTACLLVLGFAPPVRAQSGMQITPDERQVLVSKDVGLERWAIVLNGAATATTRDDTVTGNVFAPGGGAPQFVWCETLRVRRGERELACSGADRCLAAPCAPPAWRPIATVTLDESFFEPPDGVVVVGPEARTGWMLAVAGAGGGVATTSGLQVTPDGAQVLVSKDVAGERWAIALDRATGNVTGNVFSPGGAAPRFLWCTPAESGGSAPGDLAFACFAADRCVAAPCRAEEFAFVAEVTLPAAFFSEPVCGDGAVQPGEDCDDGNGNDFDACSNTCQPARCGDGRVQAPEQCDDGNGDDLDACSNACRQAMCGDGRVQAGEQCDDGNRNDADGCTNACAVARCGDGVCRDGESCGSCGQDCGACPTCERVDGEWGYDERGTIDCGDEIGSFPAGARGGATIRQDDRCGVAIDVSVPGAQFTMRGTLSGSSINVSGPLYYDLPGLPPGVDIEDRGWRWQGSVGQGGFRLDGSGSFCVVAAGRRVACCGVSSGHRFER